MNTISTSDLSRAELAKLMDERRKKNEALVAKLPPFDIYKALMGEPYVWVHDPKKAFAEARIICAPHAGWLIWIGDWIVFTDEDEMCDSLRMADLGVMGSIEVHP